MMRARAGRRAYEADVASRAVWARVCIAVWVTMIGALLAAAPVIRDALFVYTLAAALVVGFPVCFLIHGSRLSRRNVNWVVFGLSVGLGVLQVVIHGPYGSEAEGFVLPVPVLLRFFLWVMVFRSLAVRTLTDAVQTVIPAVSVLLLVLITDASSQGLVGVALIALGALALLSHEHQALADAASDAITRIRVQADDASARRSRRPSVYSWPTLYVVVIVMAAMTGMIASSLHMTSQLGQDIQILLARKLAGFFIRDAQGYMVDDHVILDGRPPNNSDRVLFQVKGEIPVNWRYLALDNYKGSTWSSSRSTRRHKDTRGDSDGALPMEDVDGYFLPATAKTQYEFTAEVTLGGALPGVLWTTRLEAPVRHVRIDEVGRLIVDGYVAPGQAYHIDAQVPSLVPIPAFKGRPKLSPEMRKQCLKLPSTLPQRVRDLARTITAGETTRLARINDIQTYLTSTYRYDTHPPLPTPGSDFVDHFLFVGKRGYCNHFASAMVMLCRCIGIPARLAVGFTQGDYDVDHDRYTVREKDMHSWPEVFLADRGWMAFEATPPQAERDKNALARAVTSLVQVAVKSMDSAHAGIIRHLPLVLLTMFLAVAAGVGRTALVHRRTWATRVRDRRATPQDRCVFAYRQMRRWLQRVGQPDRSSLPPLEYLARVRAHHAAFAADAEAVTDAYIPARFGAAEPGDAEATAAEEALGRLRDAVRAPRQGRQTRAPGEDTDEPASVR
jgi:transglutaminase-like putative cysteine protease